MPLTFGGMATRGAACTLSRSSSIAVGVACDPDGANPSVTFTRMKGGNGQVARFTVDVQSDNTDEQDETVDIGLGALDTPPARTSQTGPAASTTPTRSPSSRV